MVDILEGCDSAVVDQVLQQIGQTMDGMKQLLEAMGC